MYAEIPAVALSHIAPKILAAAVAEARRHKLSIERWFCWRFRLKLFSAPPALLAYAMIALNALPATVCNLENADPSVPEVVDASRWKLDAAPVTID